MVESKRNVNAYMYKCMLCGKVMILGKDEFIFSNGTYISSKGKTDLYPGMCYCAEHANLWSAFEEWLKTWIENGSQKDDYVYIEFYKIMAKRMNENKLGKVLRF